MNDEPAPVDAADSLPAAEPAPAAAPAAPDKPVRSRTERREQAAADALRGLIRDYLIEKCPSALESPEPMQFTLRVQLLPGEPGEMSFLPPLRRQLSRQVEVRSPEPLLFEEGAVYDFHDEKTDCRPAEADQVFAGYDSMGHPRWISYTQLLLDAGDPDVGELHQPRGRPVIRFQRGKDLKAGQLGSFGKSSRTYSLLGQVTAGMYRLPPAWARQAGRDSLALTFQVVETRDGHGKLRLRLNTLAGGLLPLELNDLFQEGSFAPLAAAREAALRELALIEEKALNASAMQDGKGFQSAMKRIPGVLQGLCVRLEGRQRPSRAEDKRPGRRQDAEWRADVREAGPAELLYDRERQSWVLLGARGFGHAFNGAGRHLASFPVNPGLIEQRIVSERWQLQAEGAEEALNRIRQENA